MFVGMGANGAGGYNLTDSLRFRSSASAYLTRTPASAGNRRTWTWSAWVKVNATQTDNLLFVGDGATTAGSGTNTRISWEEAKFNFSTDNTSGGSVRSLAVLRDPSAWYHLVCAVDTTQATSTDRVKLYINGEVVTSFDRTTYPALNRELGVNDTTAQVIGKYSHSSSGYFDGYMTEVNLVDGQALTPSDFGETDTDTGVWKPKKYTGTYGTNGFYLKGRGTDNSGNGNNFTENNFNTSNSALTTYDIMSDVPTLTNEDTANYPVYNPLIPPKVSSSAVRSISAANLYVTNSGPNGWSAIGTTMLMTSGSGKWYWEVTCSGTTSNGTIIGIHRPFTTATFPNEIIGYTGDPDGYSYYINGNKYNNSSTGVAYGASYTTGDVIGVALDMSTAGSASITFYKNNTSQGVAFSSLTGDFFAAVSQAQANGLDINFGQRPFAYTPPTGYKKLNTYNLPNSSIKDGSQYFDTKLWTGNGTSQTISGLEFAPDLVWGKSRSTTGNHVLVDSIRGDNTNLNSNLTNAESSGSSVSNLVNGSFDVAGGGVNASSVTMVGWSWRASDSAAVSNTDGDITSTVSANPTSGFSVVSWVADNSASTRIGHGLGTTPKIAIIKNRNTVSNWQFYTTAIDGSYDFLYLNLTNAKTDSGLSTFTSTTIAAGGTSTNTDNMIAYCFADVEGYSKMGTYTGNGSADGTFVYTGFRPAFVLFKKSSGVEGWYMKDTEREQYNVMDKRLSPNSNAAEGGGTSGDYVDFLSNGFKCRDGAGQYNEASQNYIYMAFAENPFKNSLAR